jgi:hypothetical protein
METHSTADSHPSEPPTQPSADSPEAHTAGLDSSTDSNPQSQLPLADAAPSSQPEPATDVEPATQAAQDSAEPDAETPTTEEPASDQENDPLADLAARAQAARLSAPEEERMGALLKEALLAGKTGWTRAATYLPKLPWIVGVRAVESTWPEMKTTARNGLLKALADMDSDAARRIRLSLARALYKLDPATATKLALSVCKELKEKETGLLSQKHAQIFANVFIGKVKPWLAQIPLADLKTPDAELLVHCAVLAVFSLPHPPITQLSVLKWAAEASKLGKLHEAAQAAALRTLSRWSTKWQSALQKDVPTLPDELRAALKTSAPTPEPAPTQEAAPDSSATAAPAKSGNPQEETVSAEQEPQPDKHPESEAAPKQRPVYEPRPQKPSNGEPPVRGRENGQRRESDQRNEGDPRKERPAYQGRNAGAGSGFNLSDTLRQIETHVQSLRAELQTAQSKLRQREEEPRPARRPQERPSAIIPGEPTLEELARLNQQLEARITELQQRIADLGVDAEDRAASMGAHGDQPVSDVNQQLRTLLGLKLQEDFADFEALEGESTSVVVQQHYRSLLRHIFNVLSEEGVQLKPQP